VNRNLAFLRRVFNLAMEDERMATKNPTRGLFLREPSGRVRYLRDEEEPELMARLAPWEQQRVTFLCQTGLRKSEFLGLRWRDVDLKAGVLTIPRSKNGERRHVPMTSEVKSLLQNRPRPLDPEALVFPNSVGGRDLRWAEKRFPRP
jgi:integrase